MKSKVDCRFFRGDKPCRYDRLCPGCPEYFPMGERILIIKLAAMGDVLRTVSLLPGLKERYPQSHITWLTEEDSIPLLRSHPLVDRLLSFNFRAELELVAQEFGILINLDKEGYATALAMKIPAEKKYGFGMSPQGTLIPLSREADYLYELGFNDELKFKVNRKTYPELIHEACGLEYRGAVYDLYLDENARAAAADLVRKLTGGRPKKDLRVGLNAGSGTKFPTKKWGMECYAELARRLRKDLGAEIYLLGGPDEVGLNAVLGKQIPFAVQTGNAHPVLDFAAILEHLDLVVTGDTLAMHLAVALKRKVIAIFGPTCESEVDLFSCGRKIAGKAACSPCYKAVCPFHMECMESVSVETVFEAARALLGK